MITDLPTLFSHRLVLSIPTGHVTPCHTNLGDQLDQINITPGWSCAGPCERSKQHLLTQQTYKWYALDCHRPIFLRSTERNPKPTAFETASIKKACVP